MRHTRTENKAAEIFFKCLMLLFVDQLKAKAVFLEATKIPKAKIHVETSYIVYKKD